MIFKNAKVFDFTKPFETSLTDLESLLSDAFFSPCASNEASKQGWIKPLGKHGEQFVHVTDNRWMICFKREERVIDGGYLKERVAEKAEEIEQAQSRKVTKKEKDEIKDELIHELLPRAFPRSKLTYAYIDLAAGMVVVNTATDKAADEITSFLRKTIGSLPIAMPTVKSAPAAVMTGWLSDSKTIPQHIEIGDVCELKDMGEEGGTIRCKGVQLDSDEVLHHIEAGKQVVNLAVTWEEHTTFSLGENLVIKSLKFSDIIQDKISDSLGEQNDAAAKFDANFSIMGAEFAKLIPYIFDMFGGKETKDHNKTVDEALVAAAA